MFFFLAVSDIYQSNLQSNFRLFRQYLTSVIVRCIRTLFFFAHYVIAIKVRCSRNSNKNIYFVHILSHYPQTKLTDLRFCSASLNASIFCLNCCWNLFLPQVQYRKGAKTKETENEATNFLHCFFVEDGRDLIESWYGRFFCKRLELEECLLQ